jgi:hypothetical protein
MPTFPRCLLPLVTVLALAACTGGDYQDVLRTLLEKERLVEQARYHLLLAATATKNAVLASTPDAARGFADEARATSGLAKDELARLAVLVAKGRNSKEAEALTRVTADFGELETVDATILGMVGRNTNLRAALLSHTEATQAVERLEQVLAPVVDGTDCQAARTALRTITACLTILSLEDRHIDEESAPTMDHLEADMRAQQNLAESALARLATLLPAGAPAMAQARAAQTELWRINEKIVQLSRENSNIISLSLIMGRKRQILAQALDDLTSLHDLVAARSFKATR